MSVTGSQLKTMTEIYGIVGLPSGYVNQTGCLGDLSWGHD
jgi:hypothetical protein